MVEIAKAFLDVLARWPWPVPFTTENMLAISKKERVTRRRLDSRRFVFEWQSFNKHREPPLSHTVCCTFATRGGEWKHVYVEHDAVCSTATIGRIDERAGPSSVLNYGQFVGKRRM